MKIIIKIKILNSEFMNKISKHKLIIILIVLIFTINYSLLTIKCSAQGVSINTSGLAADASAILDVSSSSQGLLIPRLTTKQRNNIFSPALSLLIFNVTTNCFEAYVNGQWYSISCPPLCIVPDIPAPAINVSCITQITWNWNTAKWATGYKWNTINNYSSAIDNGAGISFIQTGIACNTLNSLYVWAYNDCGKSSHIILTGATSPCVNNCIGNGLISTVAGSGSTYPSGSYGGDGGPATNAQLQWPIGVAVDCSGNVLYIGDTYNNRIRKVSLTTGIITTIAGTGTGGYNGDGIFATAAEINFPTEIALDNSGNIYISDLSNNRVRKVDVSTGIISTLAGNGTAGFSGDGGPATSASLNGPFGVAVDNSGNIYIAETNNHRIRKVTVSTGTISTISGTGVGTYNGDGIPATSASLSQPIALTVDATGNVYIAEWSGARARKITASTGLISTIAGGNGFGESGDGGPATSAQMMTPEGIALDSYGNVYISDENGRQVRKVNISTGIISTVAGVDAWHVSYNGDGIPATNAYMWDNTEICFDGAGNLYIADPGNNRIRKVCP
jgi:sugar lactone lactonase YvrE